MTLQDAIDNSTDGQAFGYTNDGRIAAEVWGPGPWLSKRKRKKRSKGVSVTVWTPPRLPLRDDGVYRFSGSTPRRQALNKVAQKTRRLLDSLDWRPAETRSAIDALAGLINNKSRR